jgi:hypothetical protein
LENTRNFAQNASADQLLPQLQMVVQELKTLEHGKFLGAILIVFKDCQEILILTMMILLLVCLSAQLPRFGAAAYKSVYQEKQRKGMVTVVIVSYVQ